MTGDEPHDPPEPAWHERTSTLLGASAGALAVLGVLYFLISSLVGGSDDPDPAGQYFLEPSATTSRYSTPDYATSTTTTQSITSTSPPVTTDIDDPNAPPSSTSTTSSTGPGFDSTTTSRTPRSDGDSTTTSRNRPRLNETRTLYPRP